MALQLLALCLPLIQQFTSDMLELEEGYPCTPLQGGSGTCTLLSRCRYPGDFRKDHPPICSFRGVEPIICCPKLTERLQVMSKARKFCSVEEYKCKERKERYEEENENSITKHVLNGDDAKPRDHIHMALIGYGSAENKEWGCGGSIINSRFILSAAHCAEPEYLGVARWARVGDLDFSSDIDDAGIQELEIVERILHPKYKVPKVYNDIALFKVDKDMVFTAWVGPVCLHTEIAIPSSQASVTGWGRVEYAGEVSSHLQEAELDVFNDTDCRNLLPLKDNKIPRGIDSKTMLCAGKRDGSKDACSGDSGGPLAISRPGQCLKIQIGITSFGSMCGLPDSPGVYTRVSSYVSWIEGIVF